MPQAIIDLLNKGAKANKACSLRQGNIIALPAHGTLIVTGDIHGHRRNFERALTYADLSNNPDRHIVLQEIIHGGPQDDQGGCLSYNLLFDAIRYKLEFPDQVHLIMGNHDTCFICDREVMKDGREMNRCMRMAIARQFGSQAGQVEEALRRFLLSQPLAVRTESKLWMSHSLPADRFAGKFEVDIFEKELTAEDLCKPCGGYLLTWGRRHSQKTLDDMAKMLDVEVFILGHQPQDTGWSKAGDNLIIIASDHNHGCLLSVNLKQSYTADQLADSIVPLASLS